MTGALEVRDSQRGVRREEEATEDRKFERSVDHGCLLALGSREMGMRCCGAGGRSTTLPAPQVLASSVSWTHAGVTREEEASSQKMPPKGWIVGKAVGHFLN